MNSRAYHQGREARRLGKPRELTDGRLKPWTRVCWFKGWDDEDRFSRPLRSPGERQESQRVISKLKDFAATL